jgi:hypothetical protein
MISIEADPEGKVVAVCADLKHHFSKSPRSSITLIAGCGIKGDAHFGSFVKHRYLARRKPRAPNMRQVHVIPTELLHGLQGAGYNVKPGNLGENITTAGLNLERTSVGNRTPDRERDYPTDGAADALRVDRPFQCGAEGASSGRGARAVFSRRGHGCRDERRPGRAGGRRPGYLAGDASARASADLNGAFRKHHSLAREVGDVAEEGVIGCRDLRECLEVRECSGLKNSESPIRLIFHA